MTDYCPLCGRITKSWIYCEKEQMDICHYHCGACSDFAGPMLWSCRYKNSLAVTQTRGARAVEDFRTRMEAIEKRITRKE